MSDNIEESAEASPVFTYSNKYRTDVGVLRALTGMVKGGVDDRRQIWVAIKRNFKTTHSNTILGFGWSLIMPLIPISAYALLGLLFGRKMSEMPYLMFVATGFTVFSIISWPIAGTLTSLRSEAGLMARSDIRITTVVLSAYGQMLWDNAIRVLVILMGVVYFQVSLHWGSIVCLALFVPAILMAFALGGVAALFYVVAKDVGNLVTIGMRYLVFFSAVIFPMPDSPMVQKWIVLNPFYTYVNEIRSLFVFGHVQKPEVLVWTIGVSVILFVVVNAILYRLEPRIRTYF